MRWEKEKRSKDRNAQFFLKELPNYKDSIIMEWSWLVKLIDKCSSYRFLYMKALYSCANLWSED